MFNVKSDFRLPCSDTNIYRSQMYKVTFGSNRRDETNSTSMLLRIKKSHCMRKQQHPLPHRPTKNTRCAPTLWLSIFHFCALHRSFLFVQSYYYYQGNFSSHPLTQRVPLPQHHDAGVSRQFSDRGRTSPSSSGGGGISHMLVRSETTGLPSTCLSWGEVCLSAIQFPQRVW